MKTLSLKSMQLITAPCSRLVRALRELYFQLTHRHQWVLCNEMAKAIYSYRDNDEYIQEISLVGHLYECACGKRQMKPIDERLNTVEIEE